MFTERTRNAELKAELKKAVSESEERYRAIVENTLDIIYTCSSDGTLTYVSPQVSSIGFSPDEVVGHNLAEFIHPDDVDKVVSDLQRAMETGEEFPTPFRVVNPDGEAIHVEEVGKVIRDDEGRNVGLTGIIRDTTQRKIAEEALNYRNEFEKLITTISTSFINLTPDGIDDGIHHALQTIGQFVGSDRSYAFQLYDDGAMMDNTHEWCAEGIEPKTDNLKGLPTEDFLWWMEKLNRLEDIYIPRVADLPPEAITEKEILQSQDIQSLIVVPMVCGGNLIGFAGFDSVREEKVWEEDVIALLRIVGEMFANALERTHAEEELRKYRDHLEGLVNERTAKLEKANEELQQEITERKKAEWALKSFAQQWQTTFDAIGDPVCLLGMDGKILQCNKAMMDFLGKPSSEIIGRTYYKLVFGTSEPPEGCPVVRILETHQRESAFWQVSGRWFNITTDPLLNESDDLMGAVCIMSDITQRKQAEDALRESEASYRELADSITDIFFATDENLRSTYWNRTSEELTGISARDAVGKSLHDLFPDTPQTRRAERIYLDVLRTRQSQSFVNEYQLGGKDFLFEISAYPSKHGLAVFAKDITQRKRMEEELVKAQKLESVGILAGGIAHDFNNLLTAILGSISLAKMYNNMEDKNRRLAEAESTCMKTRDLTQQFLTFSRGGAPIRKTTSIAEVLKDSAIFALRGSNVRCEFSIPDNLWPVEVDQGQMNQVINNIVINADQAMPNGGIVRICGENIAIGAEPGLPLQTGTYIRVSIEDQGFGIPQENLGQIFDPYFTTKHGGSGLGLAAVYFIIKKHDGHIIAESEVGVGTTFRIYLPASPGKMCAVKEEEKEHPITGEGRALVMDDEKYIRDLTAEMLSSIGYKVTTAIDGVEAIELYKEAIASGNPFDAVILDLTVPGGMGGRETIQNLIEIDSKVKAIVSSGYSNDPIMADFKEYGFKGVIAKPYKTRELGEVLHKVITE